MTNEEQIQRRVELGEVIDNLDAKAYQRVFSGLKKEPELRLPSSFADRVVTMVAEKRESKSSSWEIILLISGAILLMIACVAAIVVTEFKFDLGFLKAISDFKGLFIFAAALLIFIHWLDKSLVRKKQAAL
jgi:hypothetical protein